jgi:hypothetical protein
MDMCISVHGKDIWELEEARKATCDVNDCLKIRGDFHTCSQKDIVRKS